MTTWEHGDIPNGQYVLCEWWDEATAFVPKEATVTDAPIEFLKLSVRSENCLLSEQIDTIGQLTSKYSYDLLEARNFGLLSLKEVRGKLARYGLTLRGEWLDTTEGGD
jgi:DNA-directed RNA polymerase subunit alpha